MRPTDHLRHSENLYETIWSRILHIKTIGALPEQNRVMNGKPTLCVQNSNTETKGEVLFLGGTGCFLRLSRDFSTRKHTKKCTLTVEQGNTSKKGKETQVRRTPQCKETQVKKSNLVQGNTTKKEHLSTRKHK